MGNVGRTWGKGMLRKFPLEASTRALRSRTAAVAFLVAMQISSAPATAMLPDVNERRVEVDCREHDRLEDAAMIADGGVVGAEVPPPGSGVVAAAVDDGSLEQLGVATDSLGRVTVHACGPQPPAAPDSPSLRVGPRRGSPLACDDGAFNLFGRKWRSPMAWRFNASTRPAGVGPVQDIEDSIIAGTRNITRSSNDCGLADKVGAKQSYNGRTANARADIVGANTFTPTCRQSGDGRSVVDFGQVGSGSAIFLCTYAKSHSGWDSIVEHDLRLNKTDHLWALDPLSADCVDELGVETVVTVGRGVGFGLDPVPEGSHSELTMSSVLNGVCQDEESSLGLGDVRGLRKLY
jgi:hypothetical protein